MSFTRWSFSVAAALVFAAPVAAQWQPVADASQVRSFVAATVPASDVTGLDVTHSGLRAEAPVATAPAYVVPELPGQRVRTSQDVAMMLVGGAGLVVGAIIGDDAGALMMFGGGVVGLIGLYQYLR